MIVYGIKNCNTVKSALEWLKKNRKEFEFHDFKVKGIPEEKLKEWSRQVGWEKLVNRRGATWRQLDAKTQSSITNERAAVGLMIKKTSVIKRPVIEVGGRVVALGFDPDRYAASM